ncbi:MAG TPA: hypothetical protein VMU69_17260 [Bradyrhizobium sp.]|nr:hypothetical protein [Bradyrhizobium sp.]
MALNSPCRRWPTVPPARRRGCGCTRWIIGGTVAAAALLLVSAGNGSAVAAEILHLRCSNPASGASWPITVDLDHSEVDSLPAKISQKWISWHDPKHGFFDLERATGELQFRNASSTGGYFLHYLCRPD